MLHNMYISALKGHTDSVMFHVLSPVKGVSGEGLQVEKLVGKYRIEICIENEIYSRESY